MRQEPMVLFSTDDELIAQVRQAADLAGCPVQVVAEPAARHRGPTMASRVLVGADQPPVVQHRFSDAPVVTLRGHGAAERDRVVMLPDARGLLVDRLRQAVATPAQAPAIAVMGASGGVGASTLARGMRWALQETTGRRVDLVDLAVPSSIPDVWGVDAADAADRLAASCTGSAAAVVDLSRWHACLLPWMEALVILAGNRSDSLAAASALAHHAQEQAAIRPVVVLAAAAGGLWPADATHVMGVPLAGVWPADRRLTALDPHEQQEVLGRGKWRARCLGIAEQALQAARTTGQR